MTKVSYMLTLEELQEMDKVRRISAVVCLAGGQSEKYYKKEISRKRKKEKKREKMDSRKETTLLPGSHVVGRPKKSQAGGVSSNVHNNQSNQEVAEAVSK